MLTLLTYLILNIFPHNLYGDIRDLNQYSDSNKSFILMQNIENYVPNGVHFLNDGPNKKQLENQIYSVEYRDNIIDITYDLNGKLYLRKYNDKFQLIQENLYEELSKIEEFSIEVSLIDRKLVLKSKSILKIYPLGVGSFDFITDKIDHPKNLTHKIKLMTPEIEEGWLDFDRAVFSQNRPWSYRGRPFLPITFYKNIRYKGQEYKVKYESLYAFHIVQHADEFENIEFIPKNQRQPNIEYSRIQRRQYLTNFNYLRREFDSHGCMRLREKDLYELYMILKSVKVIKVKISYHINEKLDHPYPVNNERYNQVKNYGTFDKPEARKESAGYLETEKVDKIAPIQLLGTEY